MLSEDKRRFLEKTVKADTPTGTYNQAYVVRGLQSVRGRKKRGQRGPLFRAIRQIVREGVTPDRNNILAAFSDYDRMADLYESVREPLPIKPNIIATNGEEPGIDEENGILYYRTRSDREKQVTYGQIDKIIREIVTLDEP